MRSLLRGLERPLGVGIALFVASLVLRSFIFVLFPHPAYPDSFYYQAVAQSLAAGHGFTVPYLWNFVEVGSSIPAHGVLPIPSNAHWMPLASLIQVPFIWLLGPTDLASALPFLVIGALVAPMTYAVVRDLLPDPLRSERWPAITAGVLAVSAGFPLGFLSQPDNFGLYALLVVPVVWIIGRLLRGDPGVILSGRPFGPSGSMVIAGALGALTFLSRTDGVLLFCAVGLVVVLERLIAWRGRRAPAIGLRHLLLFCAVGLALVLPWLIRQELVFNSLSPSGATGRILWIRTYAELFGADGPLPMSHLLSFDADWTFGELANSRIAAASFVLLSFGLTLSFVVMAPLAILSFASQVKRRVLRPYLVWAGLFIAWSILLAAPHLPTGNFLHSAVALEPLIFLLGVVGLDRVGRRIGRSLPARSTSEIRNRLLFSVFVVAIFLSGVFAYSTVSDWRSYYDRHVQALEFIESHGGTGDVVMAADPGAFFSIAGRTPAIQTPASSREVIARAAFAYDARWLVLERRSIVPELKDVLLGRVAPDWLSEPLLTVPAKDGGAPEIVVYRILTP